MNSETIKYYEACADRVNIANLEDLYEKYKNDVTPSQYIKLLFINVSAQALTSFSIDHMEKVEYLTEKNEELYRQCEGFVLNNLSSLEKDN